MVLEISLNIRRIENRNSPMSEILTARAFNDISKLLLAVIARVATFIALILLLGDHRDNAQ